jgi:cyanophycinase-like exopeptidase
MRVTSSISQSFLLFLMCSGFVTSTSAGGKGFVLAMGGGNGTAEIYEKRRNLGGASKAHVVLIPTANNPGDEIAPVISGLKQVFGVEEVAVFDTKDRTKANSDLFVAPLKQATFGFIDGGRQWRLADAYLDQSLQSSKEPKVQDAHPT